MAVFNVNGSEISSVFNVSGVLIQTAYDIDGDPVINPTPVYPIDNVVSYYRNDVLSVCSEVDALSEDWQSFVFITDPHYWANQMNSQAIALYVLANTSASMIVLGGDYCDSSFIADRYNTYMSPFFNSGMMDKIYAIFGNHEQYPQTDYVAQRTLAEQTIYNDFLKDKSHLVGQMADNYYYFDDTSRKVRYMFLNTSDGDKADGTKMSDEQISWISSNVVLPDTTWSLLVIGHVTLNNMGGPATMNEQNGSDIVSAILNCNGTIIGYLCGHQHFDYHYFDGSIHHMTIICDRFDNTNWADGIAVTDRVRGTTSEQAVSVISFNTKTKDVVIRRIGAGRQQTLSYNYA